MMVPPPLQAASVALAIKSRANAVQAELRRSNVRITNVKVHRIFNGFAVNVHGDDLNRFLETARASAMVKTIHPVVSVACGQHC